MATLIRIDRNGTKYYEGRIECDRCNGKGTYYIGVCNGKLVPSWVDNGVCFKCNGAGYTIGKWKEYAPEYEAKLEAKRRAKAEARAKEYAEEQARIEAEKKAKEEAERIERERAEAEEKAKKAISQYVGQVGDKVELDVILEKNAWFEIPSFRGFGTDTMHVYTFRDDNGNALVWKTSKGLGIENGSRVHIKGTVKDHSEYNDEKQTLLTRCKIEAGE